MHVCGQTGTICAHIYGKHHSNIFQVPQAVPHMRIGSLETRSVLTYTEKERNGTGWVGGERLICRQLQAIREPYPLSKPTTRSL